MKQSRTCWLCKSNDANSDEHKYKKELLKKASFNGTKKDEKPYLFDLQVGNGTIKGPSANKVLYKDVICTTCNDKLTQPWDMAYDKLTNFFISQNKEIHNMDLKEIFGNNYVSVLEDLLKYFIKSLGCAIVDHDCELPDYFPAPLNNFYMDQFKVTICRSDSTAILLAIMTEEFSVDLNTLLGRTNNILSKGSLQITFSKSHFDATGIRKVTSAIWWESIGNFRITYWFNKDPLPRFGSILDGATQLYPLIECDLDIKEIKQYDNILYTLLMSYEGKVA